MDPAVIVILFELFPDAGASMTKATVSPFVIVPELTSAPPLIFTFGVPELPETDIVCVAPLDIPPIVNEADVCLEDVGT